MNEVIHASADFNPTGYTYTTVYASAAASPTINGTTVSMAAGSSIPIGVKSISSTPNVFILGTHRVISPTVING